MIDVSKSGHKAAKPGLFSRRDFLAGTSAFGAFYAAAKLVPLRALAAELAADTRVSATPLVDKGFASVRKIGEGLYATISDPSKGFQTLSNGGFLIGKDGAMLIEGFISAPGAAFQMDALRMVTQVPAKCALDTHYHYDHTMGNSYYGANGVPLWAHPHTAERIIANYAAMQRDGKAAVLAPLEKAMKEAKTETARQHRTSGVSAFTNVFNATQAAVIGLPNHPIDLAALPLKVDLGGLTAIIEHYPGHSGTDMIVRVPEQNVVYTGDLLFSGIFPVTFDTQATVSGWRQTLKTFASWDKDTLFVPGHGPVCGQDGVALFRSMFDDIEEQAQKMRKSGVPADEAQDLYVIPEKFKNTSVFAWDFSVGPTILKLYAEWEAK
ncbi:MAG TPA: MBL fold metallo-hydrolase [Candidatus Acidoferrum sp.]|nr:MBL fold metallo-hydrolase [Candidatus Acidoferrum sp.]